MSTGCCSLSVTLLLCGAGFIMIRQCAATHDLGRYLGSTQYFTRYRRCICTLICLCVCFSASSWCRSLNRAGCAADFHSCFRTVCMGQLLACPEAPRSFVRSLPLRFYIDLFVCVFCPMFVLRCAQPRWLCCRFPFVFPYSLYEPAARVS